ncbi:MAG: DUF4349 domain-containing protein [Deltaproteobacteria bacterium]|nr:DUF4349 domain-containing protein [Deltaproteobacteria bacterium]
MKFHYFILLMALVFISGSVFSKDQENKNLKTETDSVKKSEEDINSLETPKTDLTKSSTPKEDDTRKTAVRVSIILKVLNPADSQNNIKQNALNIGGFASYMSDNSIIIKIPPKKLNEAISKIELEGTVLTKNLNRQDITMDIAQLNASLVSKEEILTKLRTFFDSADLESTLDIEQNMFQIVNEIENIKGQLRLLKDQSDWNVIDISFQFRERESVNNMTSPFTWLNSANVTDFLENF